MEGRRVPPNILLLNWPLFKAVCNLTWSIWRSFVVCTFVASEILLISNYSIFSFIFEVIVSLP
jgi:hypothetical protein